jgi:uncharacterized membrane protein
MTMTRQAIQPSEKLFEDRPATGDRWFHLASIILAFLGTADSLYLSYIKLTSGDLACSALGGGCGIVNSSYYAYVGGVYVGYIGLVGYVAILAALLLEKRIGLLQQHGKLLVGGMTMFGFLFSGYLTAVEAFILHQWCQWCVISAIIMTLLFGLSLARLFFAPLQDSGQTEEETNPSA